MLEEHEYVSIFTDSDQFYFGEYISETLKVPSVLGFSLLFICEV